LHVYNAGVMFLLVNTRAVHYYVDILV